MKMVCFSCCKVFQPTNTLFRNIADLSSSFQMKAYRGLTGGFLLLRNFSVAVSVSRHIFFILVLISISMFLR